MKKEGIKPNVIANLDPGIRSVVVWLNERGFHTTDSGDGVSKPEVGRVFNRPHVFMTIEGSPDLAKHEAERLLRHLKEASIKVKEGQISVTFDPCSPNVWVLALFDVAW